MEPESVRAAAYAVNVRFQRFLECLIVSAFLHRHYILLHMINNTDDCVGRRVELGRSEGGTFLGHYGGNCVTEGRRVLMAGIQAGRGAWVEAEDGN